MVKRAILTRPGRQRMVYLALCRLLYRTRLTGLVEPLQTLYTWRRFNHQGACDRPVGGARQAPVSLPFRIGITRQYHGIIS